MTSFEHFVPLHLVRTCFGHVVSQERSCHFVSVISLAIVHLCVRRTFIELVTHVQSAHHVVVAAWLQWSFASAYLTAYPHQLQPSCSKLLRCLQILVAAQSRRARCVASVLPSLGTAASRSGLADSFRSVKMSSRRFACAGWFPFRVVILARHSWLSDHQATLAANVARNSDTTFFAKKTRPPSSPFLGFRYYRSGFHFWVHHGNVSCWCSSVGVDFHPGISEYSQKHFAVRAFFFVALLNAAARHHCYIVAHDVSHRPCVETESVTVQPFHGEFLLCSRRLVWLELYLLTECCNLLIDWFAADTLVSRHTVTANMERRQCPCCMSYKPFQAPICRSAQSSIARIFLWMVWFRSPVLPLALLTPTGLSSYTISVGMCVPTVFDVNDAKFLVALHCHFLMTCGQHVVRECSFCAAMSLPAGMVIGVPSSPMNIQSVATFDTPPGLDSWCGLSLPLARTQCLHQLRNGGFVNSCCATPASLGNTGTFQVLAAPAVSCPKTINNLTPPFSDIVFASCVGSLPIHHHHAHTQCGCH